MKIKKRWIALIAGLGVLWLIGSTAQSPANKTAQSNQSAQTQEPAKPKTFSKAQYGKVQNGMTLAQVQKVFGAEGEQVTESETELMGQKMAMVVHMWRNPDFSNATVTFQNGEVAGKAQANLK